MQPYFVYSTVYVHIEYYAARGCPMASVTQQQHRETSRPPPALLVTMAEELPLVLITGAAGSVGTILRNHWNDAEGGPLYRLRLADLAAPRVRGGESPDLSATLAEHEEAVEFDCADYDAFLAACQGVHAVVHLAADPSPSAEFYGSLLQRNIIGERRPHCRTAAL